MNITSIICDYESNNEDICAIRYEVFIDEQNVPEELEIDGLDGEAKHVLAFVCLLYTSPSPRDRG